LDWAARFGFGRPTGIDLPGESAGSLPTGDCPNFLDAAGENGTAPFGVREGRKRQTAAAPMLAVGQGELTATPLQVAVMMAAVANGGRRVVPHVVARGDCPNFYVSNNGTVPLENSPTGASLATLQAVREGLRRVVADPRGTAHETVDLESVSIAGKPGTAETGPGAAAHAWFAGYAPAENPKIVFVVALEHAGDAAAAAGPIAKRLVERMKELRLFSARE